MTQEGSLEVAWHDLECGGYDEDLDLWRELASESSEAILDVGAGTGRISLMLAREGHEVVALEQEAELLRALQERAAGLPLRGVLADAREVNLTGRFGLCIIAMQTLQLLGGRSGRLRFLERAARHLVAGGRLAAAIVSELQPFDHRNGSVLPLPDVAEREGRLLWSQPTAIRIEHGGFILERRRELVEVDGTRTVSEQRIHLDRLSAGVLEQEAAQAGLSPVERRLLPATPDYAPSEVVILGA